jgi:hypothetical protein
LRNAVAIEDRIRHCRFEANSLIPDDDVCLVVDAVELHVDRGAGRGVLGGVAEQVRDDLDDGIRIRGNGGRLLRQSPNLDIVDSRRRRLLDRSLYKVRQQMGEGRSRRMGLLDEANRARHAVADRLNRPVLSLVVAGGSSDQQPLRIGGSRREGVANLVPQLAGCLRP